MTKILLAILFTGLLSSPVVYAENSRAPKIPEFDLSDLKALTEESKASETSWLNYQTAMTAAFTKTKTFLSEDGVSEFKLQAAKRFLKIFGQVDNPYSTLDNDQVKVITGYISSLSEELPVEVSSNYGSNKPTRKSPTEKLDNTQPDIELGKKTGIQCTYVFEHCALESMLSATPIKITDERITFDPQLTKVGERWFPLVNEIASKTPYSGTVRGTLPDGQLTTELSFEKGILAGPFKKWWPNGAIAVEGRNKKGFLNGTYKEWYSNGQLRKSTTMRMGTPVKRETLWYFSGAKKAEVSLSSRGALNGKTQAWYPNGQLYFEGSFSIGTVYKEHSIFHSNGELAIKYSPLERVKCIGRRMQTNCPSATMMTIKKKAERYDNNGILLWSSNQKGLTRWDQEGKEIEFIPNTLETIL